MKRIYIVAEGVTEETFVKRLLIEPFLARQIYVTPILLGGMRQYSRFKKDVTRLLADRSAYVTTMMDFYGLDKVSAFPKLVESRGYTDPHLRANFLEKALAEDLRSSKFLPNILVHEFEALLFSDPKVLASQLNVKEKDIDAILQQFGNDPELINNSVHTAPSKRLWGLNQSYQKVVDGNLAAIRIGIDTIRRRCGRFHSWLERLENL